MMKKLMIGLIALGSFSAIANQNNDNNAISILDELGLPLDISQSTSHTLNGITMHSKKKCIIKIEIKTVDSKFYKMKLKIKSGLLSTVSTTLFSDVEISKVGDRSNIERKNFIKDIDTSKEKRSAIVSIHPYSEGNYYFGISLSRRYSGWSAGQEYCSIKH
jgi:hypothetical protein